MEETGEGWEFFCSPKDPIWGYVLAILSPIVVMTVNALFLCRWLIRLSQSRYLVSQLIFHKSGPELFLTMVRTAATKTEFCLYIFINCFAGIPYMNSPVVSCSCSRAITSANCLSRLIPLGWTSWTSCFTYKTLPRNGFHMCLALLDLSC